MTTEMLNHIERVGESLIEVVEKVRKYEKGRGIDQRPNPYLLREKYEALTTEEERAKARIELDKEWEENKLCRLFTYIQERTAKAPKSQNGVVWRKQRIKELQEELCKLTKEQEHEKQLGKETTPEQDTEVKHEISQS